MKRRTIACAAALALILTGCGSEKVAKNAPGGNAVPRLVQDAAPASSVVSAAGGEIDVDLTQMSATMVYAEVFQMTVDPQSYVGKTVRMQGQSFSMYYEQTAQTYHSVIIADATACCQQGLEYLLPDGAYPPDEREIAVTGVFETYEELGETYCRLGNAALET